MSPRRRLMIRMSLALGLAWTIALGGYVWARNLKVTPQRVSRFLQQTPFSKLTPDERLKVIRKLAEMLVQLSPDERRGLRMDAAYRRLFQEFTLEEKGLFLELTVPSGFNQMLTAFENMPVEKRRKAVSESIRRLQEARERSESGEVAPGKGGTNAPMDLPPELQEKMVTLGLKSFYENGSPDLKAEAAPLIEELQRNLENGRIFRRGPRRE